MKPIADAGCRRVLLGLCRARRPDRAVATSLVEVDPDRCCLRRCHGVEDAASRAVAHSVLANSKPSASGVAQAVIAP